MAGWGIGIIGGSGNINTSGSETEGGGDKEKTIATEKEGLLYGSIFAEYTFGEEYGLTFGASWTPVDAEMGTKSRTDTRTADDTEDTGGGSDDSGVYTAKAEISNHSTFYIEPTFMPSENFGVYLKGGVARVTVNSLESIARGENSSAYGDETVLGGMYGLGTKVVFDSGFMFKFEYTKTIYETVTMASKTGNKNIISADPEMEAVKFAVGYKF